MKYSLLMILTILAFGACADIPHARQQLNSDKDANDMKNDDSRPSLEFTISGGMPPAAREVLKLYDDGTVSVLIGNAWPGGIPLDEAGIYRMILDEKEMKDLMDSIERSGLWKAKKEYGPFYADSGMRSLKLRKGVEEKEISWNSNAEIPAFLNDLNTRLGELIHRSRKSPLYVLKAAFELGSKVISSGQAVDLTFTISNLSSVPLKVKLSNEQFPSYESSVRYLLYSREDYDEVPFPMRTVYFQGEKTLLKDVLKAKKGTGFSVIPAEGHISFTVAFTPNIAEHKELALAAIFEFQMEPVEPQEQELFYGLAFMLPQLVTVQF